MYNHIQHVYQTTIKHRNKALLFLLLSCTTLAFGKKTKILVQSTEGLSGAAGIYLADNKFAYTASLPKKIRILNVDSGKYVGEAFSLTPNFYGFFDDLVIFPHGFSITSFLDGRVWTITKDGQTIQSNNGSFLPVPQSGIYAADFNPTLLTVNPITYRTSNDRLYVATAFNPAAIFKLDWRGSAPETITLSEPVSLNGFQFGPDDKLYGPDTPNNRIVKIDADTGAVSLVASGIPSPIAVKVDSNGIVYTISRRTGELFKYNPATPNNAPIILATLRPALDNLSLDKDETKIYVTNDQCDVYEVNINSGHSSKIFSSPIKLPTDLAFDGKSLYVADQGTLRQLNRNNGHEQRKLIFDSATSGLAGFGQVTGLTVELENDGYIIVTDQTQGNIAVLKKSNFEVVNIISGFVSGLVGKQPYSAIRIKSPTEHLLVTNAVDNTIVKIDANGIPSAFLSNLRTPVKLKIHDKFIYIVEAGILDQAIPNTGRISRLPLNNPVPSALEVLVTDLYNPQGLDIVDNKMFIIEVGNNRLLEASATCPSTPKVIKKDLQLDGYPIIISQFNPKPLFAKCAVAVSKKGKMIAFNQPIPNNIVTIKHKTKH